MNKVVSMDEMIPLIEEKLGKGGEVSFTPKGISMLPLLKSNRDMVTLKKATFPLKKYQIAFYKREDGGYVLHRVIKVKKDSYTMRGDNQFCNETGVTEDQIIGVVSDFTKNGKKYNGTEKDYVRYCKIWVNTIRIRYWLKRFRRFARRVKRKLIIVIKRKS